jgi:hydrogenase nickel incorporation protein HypA/HybF
MHELSIALSMIEQVIEESENRGGLEIEAVYLKLGVFSGVDKGALLFAYDLACEGTPLEGSRLVISTVPLVIFCPQCKQQRAPVSVYELCCPDCLVPA